MRTLLILVLPFITLPMFSCAESDPDLNPQSSTPASSSRKVPWNTPISGQGGGPLGNLPQQERR
ncbi:MAG: hypothetical protein ACQKBU_03590 [Verrucomicrobiales bacterium]